MPHDINVTRNPPCAIPAPELPASQAERNDRNRLTHALRADDWPMFEALMADDDTGWTVEDRHENGQNCLHIAITSGSYSIASNLAQFANEFDVDLINVEDQFGYTPIMYAAESPIDNPELVDTLIKNGAHAGLPRAVKSAAERGHTEITRRLVASMPREEASKALAEVLQHDENQSDPNAAKLLISLGVDATVALEYAGTKYWLDAAKALVLLGAKGSDALVLMATQSPAARNATVARSVTTSGRRALIQTGSDVATALTTLAKRPKNELNSLGLSRLIATDELVSKQTGDTKPSSATAALLRLADSGDIAAMLVLAEQMDSGQLGCDELAKSGNVDALRALASAGLVTLQRTLERAAHTRNFAAAKTLINTGMSTSTLLHDMWSNSQRRKDPDRFEAIKLLIAAGADASALPNGLSAEIELRKEKISDLSPTEKNVALLSAAINGDTTEAAMLLEREADIADALKQLSGADDLNGLRTLIKAGKAAPATLIDRVLAGDMDGARALTRALDVSTEALIHLIKNGESALARRFIPDLTNGREALVEAAQRNDGHLARTLIDLGADGPGALLSLLETKYREEAARLAAWGVNIHKTMALAVSNDSVIDERDLITMGADLSIALMHAIEADDSQAAEKLLRAGGVPAGQKALLALAADDTVPAAVKRARVATLVGMQVDTDGLLEQFISDKKIPQLQALIDLGVPTDRLLMDLGKQGNRIDARTLIMAGADIATAMATLLHDREQNAVTVLGVALAGAREEIIAEQRRDATGTSIQT